MVDIEDVHDRRFHETIHDELFRHFRNTGSQGSRSQFLLDVDHWFLFGKGSHVSHFPDGRKMLFSTGGIQDFRDGLGHQVAVFFQQPAGCSIRSAGLPWIEDIQCSLYVLFGYP